MLILSTKAKSQFETLQTLSYTSQTKGCYCNLLPCLIVFRKVHVSEDVRRELKKQTFDNWQWDDSEMLILLRQMYIDLNLISKLNLDVSDVYS